MLYLLQILNPIVFVDYGVYQILEIVPQNTRISSISCLNCVFKRLFLYSIRTKSLAGWYGETSGSMFTANSDNCSFDIEWLSCYLAMLDSFRDLMPVFWRLLNILMVMLSMTWQARKKIYSGNVCRSQSRWIAAPSGVEEVNHKFATKWLVVFLEGWFHIGGLMLPTGWIIGSS